MEAFIIQCCSERAECSCSRCLTLVFCFFSAFYSIGLSIAVLKTGSWWVILIAVLVVLCNLVLLRSTWREQTFNPSYNCLSACLSIVILMTVSFHIISRDHYYGRWPKDTVGRVGSSSLLWHKMGLILLVAGVPLMYKCECKYLAEDKETIYTILADFLDIYDMASVLALGSPTCKRVDSNYELYNRRLDPRFHCTESANSSLKEGGSTETAVQVFCSFSFMIFVVIYAEAGANASAEAGAEAGTEAQESQHIKSLKKYIRYIILLQDIPLFCIRTSVWIEYGFQTDQFLFLVKNAVSASLTVIDFFFPIYLQEVDQDSTQSPDQANERGQQTGQTNSAVDGRHP